jgi:hypothetical protein
MDQNNIMNIIFLDGLKSHNKHYIFGWIKITLFLDGLKSNNKHYIFGWSKIT